MKKYDLILLGLKVPVDYIMLLIAGLVAYFIRFTPFITDIRPVIFNLPLINYINILLLVSLFWLVIFALNGLYTYEKKLKFLKIFIKVFVSATLATMLIIIAFFFDQQLFNSRLIILAFWVFSILLVLLGRLFLLALTNYFYQKGYIYNNAVIIGNDSNTKILLDFYKNKNNGIKVTEVLPELNSDTLNHLKNKDLKKIDELILTDKNYSPKTITSLINFCQENHIVFKYTANVLETKLKNFEFSTISSIPIIEIKNTPLEGWWKIIKRLFDFLSSLILIIILSPVFSLLSIFIVLDSKGPVILKFRRVGENNHNFYLYKFRSMIKDAHRMKSKMQDLNERKDGPLFKIQNDPRITRFGKFLRKYSLDELPQLFNVIKGEMSLVGPRPHEPEEVEKYENHQKRLLNIKPGMTGLAAISGRSNLVFDEEVKLDTFYIENWSILLDIIILVKTPFIVLIKKAV